LVIAHDKRSQLFVRDDLSQTITSTVIEVTGVKSRIHKNWSLDTVLIGTEELELVLKESLCLE